MGEPRKTKFDRAASVRCSGWATVVVGPRTRTGRHDLFSGAACQT